MLLFRVFFLLLLVNMVSGQPPVDKRAIESVLSAGIVKRVKDNKEVLHPGIHPYLNSLVDTSHFQGVALVVEGNTIIHKSVYGKSSREENIPIHFGTQYLLGSLSKSFVSIAIMQLVEAGKLDLFTPVTNYLPELSEELAKGLNVHLLLKHQSGLAANLDDVTKYPLMEITAKRITGTYQ